MVIYEPFHFTSVPASALNVGTDWTAAESSHLVLIPPAGQREGLQWTLRKKEEQSRRFTHTSDIAHTRIVTIRTVFILKVIF